MKTIIVALALALTACVSITKHSETELQLEDCRVKLELSTYHLLHASKAAASAEVPTTASIVVTPERVLVNGLPLPGPDVASRLEQIHEEDPETLLLINAEPDVPYGTVIEVMDEARMAGFTEYHLGVGPASPILAGEE